MRDHTNRQFAAINSFFGNPVVFGLFVGLKPRQDVAQIIGRNVRHRPEKSFILPNLRKYAALYLQIGVECLTIYLELLATLHFSVAVGLFSCVFLS